MEYYRLFAAIRPSDKIVRDLTRFQKGIPGARWSDAEKLHITLGFFGDVDGDRAEVLDEKLAHINKASFDLSLSGAGHFGRSEPHSVWIGVAPSPDLIHLHKSVRSAARAAGVIMEKREYRPHVTLAYLRPFPDIEAIARWEHKYSGYQSASFLVDGFFLYSSWQRQSGSNLYREEASYPLLG